MSDYPTNDRAPDEQAPLCPACGTPYRAGDRFCAECGRYRPTATAEQPEWPAMETGVIAAPMTPRHEEAVPAPSPNPGGKADGKDTENAAWILGARPGAVIAGGFLLLLLAAGLLAVGQRDATGTIVMLSICVAPLGLLTIAIGIARQVAGALRRERE